MIAILFACVGDAILVTIRFTLVGDAVQIAIDGAALSKIAYIRDPIAVAVWTKFTLIGDAVGHRAVVRRLRGRECRTIFI